MTPRVLLAIVALAGCGNPGDPSGRTVPSHQSGGRCGAALHVWQTSASPAADGLPESGTATEVLADVLLAQHRQTLLATYNATAADVVTENGAAWVDNDGDVVVVDEELAVVELVLDDPTFCPRAPAFYNGIPLSFSIRGVAAP